MASTYRINTGHPSENERTNASEGIESSPPASTSSKPLVQSKAMVSTSTTSTQPENEVANAFDGIQPFSFTSEASSASKKKWTYDAYISHCFFDCKASLATKLYYTLTGMGLRVFLNWHGIEYRSRRNIAQCRRNIAQCRRSNGIEVLLPTEAEETMHSAEEAMRSAWLLIVIFSKNYVTSSWCLAELSFMVKTGTRFVPLFHRVQPNLVEYIYSKAFSEHEKNSRYAPEKLQEWKQALRHIPYHLGQTVNDWDDESRLHKNIVNSILEVKRNSPVVIGKYPVGLDEVVADFEWTTLQSAESHNSVRIVGIWGIGGSGKTTLAKNLFDSKYKTMERYSFIFYVRDASQKSQLLYKQKKLIEDLGLQGVSFDSIEEGKQILASRLRSVRVLIVLDDVDSVDQLNALIPEKANLGSGSLIVVTTRQLDVLQCWGISSICKMKALSDTQAKELFCWHAFLKPSPKFGFEDLVGKFISVCQGLPLSLKVLGGQLYGIHSKDDWERELSKISTILPGDIKSRLRVSYDALDHEEKEVFLDIACFLNGEKKSSAIALFEGRRWHGLAGLETLMNKCLVEFDPQSCIRIQGPLRDLGREIANERPPYRLWSSTQIDLIKQHAEETLQIRGIMAAITQFSSCSAHHEFPSYSSPWQPPFEECFKSMQNSVSPSFPHKPLSLGLKFLVVTGDDLSRKFAKLSEDLIWLRWFDFKHTKLPSWLSLKNLRILELYGASTLKELWEDGTQPPFLQLTELNITCSWGSSLQKFPSSISVLKHLKKIALIGYLGDEFPIKRLPEEFCELDKLEHLELRHCRVLSSLPSRFGELAMLRHLDLSCCVELRMLPVSFKQLKHLEYLDLSGCRKLTFRLDFLENVSNLEKLDCSGCRRLQVLPERITSQVYLRKLDMRGTRLRNMPSKIGELRRLENLLIGSPLLTDLPSSLGDLSSLTRLTIFDCPNLKYLPDSAERLASLEYLCLECSGVECLPKSFSKLANLQTLEIFGCPISELDFGKGSSSSCLKSLNLVHIADTKVYRISITEDSCPVLRTLKLMQNEVLVEIITLPTSLEEIELWECESLKDINCVQDLSNLKNIQIKISGCPQLNDTVFTWPLLNIV